MGFNAIDICTVMEYPGTVSETDVAREVQGKNLYQSLPIVFNPTGKSP
jgi:hypothetical protein